jgi:hypothetical protein
LDLDSIRARLQALQQEIAQLRAENERYLEVRLHSSMETNAHTKRAIRLEEIFSELSQLAKTKNSPGELARDPLCLFRDSQVTPQLLQ